MVNEKQVQQTPITHLRQLDDLLAQIMESLKAQREILKRRGANLPPMVMKSLQSMNTDLKQLERNLIDEQTELSQLRALSSLSTRINESLDVGTVLEEMMDVVITLTKAERGHIILKNEDTGELEFRISRDDGGLSTRQGAGSTPEVSNTVINKVLETGEALLADNAYQEERFQHNMSIANISLRSVLCVPLTDRDNVIGVVYVDNRLQAGVFTEREKNMLTAFSNISAVALANARMYAHIQHLITEITRVKELMTHVFDSIGSGVIATNAKNSITTFNRAAEVILEQPSTDAIGENLAKLLPDVSAHLQEHLDTVREKHETQSIDAEISVSSRGSIAVNMKLSPLKDVEQVVQGVALVVDDVTEEKRREQHLHVAKTYLPPELVDQVLDIANLGLGGDRREVTSMFADVRPVLTLQGIRPKEVMQIINVYQSVATECIHEVGGIVDKYMGNEVMALFNTQLNPLNNHAQQAIEAAMLMRERFIELYKTLNINPDPHFYIIGMHTGVATMGNVGSLNRREFTAIGDTINLSKRVEENASPGQILISLATYDHVLAYHEGELAFRFEEREAIHAKGQSKATHVYEVLKN